MNVKELIKKYDRIRLTPLPTPLKYAKKLTEHLGGPKIFFKRDDFTSLALGGNKTRKLEFLMADAVRNKADVIITLGGLQSNWARQTAAAARKCGMDIILALEGADPGIYQGNLLLDRILGCDIRFIERITQEEEDQEINSQFPITGKIADELKKIGIIAYPLPLGGTNPLGNLGYICTSSIIR